MKMKMVILALAVIILSGIFTGCMADNRNLNEQPEDVKYYEPTRYGDDMYYDNQREPDLNRDRMNIRKRNERDTPYNMDEEEPDLDEEPSEQRQGR